MRQQRGRWVVRVDGIDAQTGVKRPRQLGTFPSQRAARAAAAEFIVEGVQHNERGNVAWAVERWLVTKADISPKALAQYEWASTHIRAGLGGIPLKRLDRADIAQWFERLANGGELSRRSIQICRTVLRAALVDAVEDGLLVRSPAARVPLPRLVVRGGLEREHPAWTEQEIGRFLQAADAHRWAAGFRIAVFYGLRRSELLALRWDDVDFEAGTLRVDEGLIEVKGLPVWTPGKSARSRRTIPIDSTTRRYLRQRRKLQLVERAKAVEWEHHDLIFTTRTGAPVQARHFDRVLERLVQAAEVPRITSHGLRHTAATHMVRQARDLGELRAVADILGHSPEMLLRVYAHTVPESLRAVSERVGRRSASLEGPHVNRP